MSTMRVLLLSEYFPLVQGTTTEHIAERCTFYFLLRAQILQCYKEIIEIEIAPKKRDCYFFTKNDEGIIDLSHVASKLNTT